MVTNNIGIRIYNCEPWAIVNSIAQIPGGTAQRKAELSRLV